MAEKQQTATCQVCGTDLVGRVDKRFCSDQCRAQLHNKKRKADAGERMILDINRILRKNRSILKLSSPLGKTTTRQDYLTMQGFNFNHFTHQYITNKGNTYYFCYDYGYLPLPDGKVLIVNWQAYMAHG
jgi:predicted nucleic acid-binding Zn ribbon protein